MTVNERGERYVDLRGCGPRELLQRVGLFLDEIYDEELRNFAGALILDDRPVGEIAARLALRRIEFARAKTERLTSVVEALETLRQENEESV